MNQNALVFAPESTEMGPEWISLGDSGYWSTRDNIEAELALARAVEDLQGMNDTLRLPNDFLNQRRQKFLDHAGQKTAFEEAEEQARVIFGDMAQPYRLTLVTGPPGATKTTVAAQWVRLARAHNPYLPIILITTEKQALHRLQDRMVEAVPDLALTLDQALQAEKPWPKYACILLDEAGLIDTAAMANLLQQAVDAQAVRVVLMGDDKQLLPEGHGQPFRWLRENKKAQLVELPHSFRQKTPQLRQAIRSFYEGDAKAAIDVIMPAFVTKERLIETIRARLQELSPEKTLVIVHGGDALRAQLSAACPTFRILSLNEAQGLAFDHAVFAIAKPIDLAAMLVGCSRQRHALDVYIDETLYPNKGMLLQNIATWHTKKMALDILNAAALSEKVDQG